MPVDVVSSRLMIQNSRHGERYRNGVQAFLLIAKEEGYRGLWKGFGASVLATGTFIVFQSYIFDIRG